MFGSVLFSSGIFNPIFNQVLKKWLSLSKVNLEVTFNSPIDPCRTKTVSPMSDRLFSLVSSVRELGNKLQ